MQVKPKKDYLKPELKVTESLETVGDLPSSFIIDVLEHNLKLRQTHIEKRLKEKLLK